MSASSFICRNDTHKSMAKDEPFILKWLVTNILSWLLFSSLFFSYSQSRKLCDDLFFDVNHSWLKNYTVERDRNDEMEHSKQMEYTDKQSACVNGWIIWRMHMCILVIPEWEWKYWDGERGGKWVHWDHCVTNFFFFFSIEHK